MAENLPSFEKAEYTTERNPSSGRCVRCRQIFADHFFLLNGKPLCDQCAEAAMIARPDGGDAAFLRGTLFGLAAAAIGGALYAAVEIGTGWMIGYVALAVGWVVGRGMKLGSWGKGGRRYQVVAVVLTYCSVSWANLFVTLHALQKHYPQMQWVVNEHYLIQLAKYELLWPMIEIKRGWNGWIELFILLIAMQAAWRMTDGVEDRITGPHPALVNAGMKP